MHCNSLSSRKEGVEELHVRASQLVDSGIPQKLLTEDALERGIALALGRDPSPLHSCVSQAGGGL